MSGIALFVPDNDMYTQSQEILSKLKNSHVSLLKLTNSEDVVSEAQKAVEQGINIIIARGRQAIAIKNNINVTVTNIIITAQELGLLINKAKNIINKDNITIGLFGWGDMFCDTTYFEQLYNITLKRYILQEDEEWRNTILRSSNDNLDIIIGGKSVLECANQIGIPGVYLSGTGESLKLAIQNAESLYRMSELEKHNYAQFSSILDSSSNGIIKISPNGKILILNNIMEDIIGADSKELVGLCISDIIPEINSKKIFEVLQGDLDNYSTVINYREQELVLVVEPIDVDEKIEGAIISFNRLQRINSTDKSIMGQSFLIGQIAHSTFEEIGKHLKGLQETIELAKLYALSASPILIESLAGPELNNITQGIHNYGMRRNNPFISINMAGMTQEQQANALFGNLKTGEKGALLNANHGTLVIQAIDKLTLPIQYRFIKAIQTKRFSPDDHPSNYKVFDTRIIACTAKNLKKLRENFLFRSDLYFTLNSLSLKIPDLNERPEDLEYLLSMYTKQFIRQYSRYHILTPRAKNILLNYSWEGNSIQLKAFCERMILTAQSRNISAEYVVSLLDELYSNKKNRENITQEKSNDNQYDPMYELILQTLEKYGGSRKLAAKELKISTTTLWRRMKHYGLIK